MEQTDTVTNNQQGLSVKQGDKQVKNKEGLKARIVDTITGANLSLQLMKDQRMRGKMLQRTRSENYRSEEENSDQISVNAEESDEADDTESQFNEDPNPDGTKGESSDEFFSKLLRQAGEPKVMDLKIVIEMFKQIKTDVTTVKNELTSIKKDINYEQVREAITAHEENSAAIKKLTQEVNKYKNQQKAMVGAMTIMDQQMSEMKTKITSLERQQKQRDLILNGFHASEDKTE